MTPRIEDEDSVFRFDTHRIRVGGICTSILGCGWTLAAMGFAADGADLKQGIVAGLVVANAGWIVAGLATWIEEH